MVAPSAVLDMTRIKKRRGDYAPSGCIGLEFEAQRLALRSYNVEDAIISGFQAAANIGVVAFCCNKGWHRSVFVAALVTDWDSRLFDNYLDLHMGLAPSPDEAIAELKKAVAWQIGHGSAADSRKDLVPEHRETWVGYSLCGHLPECRKVLDKVYERLT